MFNKKENQLLTGIIFISLILLELLCRTILLPYLEDQPEKLSQYENDITWAYPAYVPHPYFGFANNPNNKFITDKWGFAYPHPKIENTEKHYIIGFFGGSVARDMARWMSDNNYEQVLRKEIPSLRNKVIFFKNYAIQGHKQPQPYIISTFHIDQFDLGIQIEGINEMSLGPFDNKDTPLSYPRLPHYFFPTNGHSIRQRDKLFLSHEKIQYWKKAITETSLFKGIVGSIAHSRIKTIRNSMNDKLNKLSQSTSVPNSYLASLKRLEWTNWTFLQHKLLNRYGRDFLFIMQPTVLTSDRSRKLTKAEENFLYNFQSITPIQIKDIKKHLSEASSVLTNLSNYKDYRFLFADDQKEAFIDYCHFNDYGARKFANQIVGELKEKLKARRGK